MKRIPLHDKNSLSLLDSFRCHFLYAFADALRRDTELPDADQRRIVETVCEVGSAEMEKLEAEFQADIRADLLELKKLLVAALELRNLPDALRQCYERMLGIVNKQL